MIDDLAVSACAGQPTPTDCVLTAGHHGIPTGRPTATTWPTVTLAPAYSRCTTHSAPKFHLIDRCIIELLDAITRAVPRLPGAACRDHRELFDRTAIRGVGMTAARAEALHICLDTCPAMTYAGDGSTRSRRTSVRSARSRALWLLAQISRSRRGRAGGKGARISVAGRSGPRSVRLSFFCTSRRLFFGTPVPECSNLGDHVPHRPRNPLIINNFGG